MKQVEKSGSEHKHELTAGGRSSIRDKVKAFMQDESGAIGIKQIAGTVAVVIVIGLVVAAIREGNMLSDWISDVWDYLFKTVKDTFDSN